MPYITFNHGGESPPQGLYLVSVSGSESISELFHFELILESDSDTEIKPTDIIGQDVSVRMDYSDTDLQSDSDARFIHGIVNCFQIISSDNTSLRRYKIDLVPSLWFLTKKSNFQIFENQKSSNY